MPPVLHVAFDELTRRSAQDVRARDARFRVHERHRVLKLIAEAERAAALIESRTPPHPTRQGLVQTPSIQHHVERRLGRPHGDHGEPLLPPLHRTIDRGVGLSHSSVLAHRVASQRFGLRRAEHDDQVARLTGCEIQHATQRRARIDADTDRAGEWSEQPDGSGGRSISSEEFAPVGRVTRQRLAQRTERDPRCELRIEKVLRVDRARFRVEPRVDLMLSVLAQSADDPLDVRRHGDSSGACAAVRDAQQRQLDRRVLGDAKREIGRDVERLVLKRRAAGTVHDRI